MILNLSLASELRNKNSKDRMMLVAENIFNDEEKMKLFAVLVMIFFFESTCYTQDRENWKVDTTFSGSSSTSTGDFKVRASDWRIAWVATQDGSTAGSLAVWLMNSDTQELMDLTMNAVVEDSTESGSSIYKRSGTYFLKVDCLNIKWKIQVEERLK